MGELLGKMLEKLLDERWDEMLGLFESLGMRSRERFSETLGRRFDERLRKGSG